MLRTSLSRPLRQFSSSSTWRNTQQARKAASSSSSKGSGDDPITAEVDGERPPPSSAAASIGSATPAPAAPSRSSSTSSTIIMGPDEPSRSIPHSFASPSSSFLPFSEQDKNGKANEAGPQEEGDLSSTPPKHLGGLPLPAYDLDEVRQRIRHWTEHAALAIRNRSDEFTASTKTRFSQLGAHLNKVTGYEEIEALKRDVVAQEHRINDTRRAARQAKAAYEEAVIQRSKSQREVNDLLQRKSTWSDNDVSRFTTLVRQDHLYEQEEQRAKASVDESEDAVEKEFSQLMRLILARYHEEQVWSDKIRSASTYGQLAALALNLLVFLLAIVLVEPWKRKRLAQTFERKVEELSEDYAKLLSESMKNIEEKLAGHEGLLLAMAEDLASQTSSSSAAAPVAAEEEVAEPLSEPPPHIEQNNSRYVRIFGLPEVPIHTVELAALGTMATILISFFMSDRW